MKLSIHDLCKSYTSSDVLKQVRLELESGQIYCLMGASGSGKTTFLRILMGLEHADSGSIEFLTDDGVPMPQPPRISAVFQEDRLCERFTPIENIRMVTGSRLSKAQILQELTRLLPEEACSRPVSTLSGGMKRRTAICRALLAEHELLLMDEPFTGLDADTKQIVIRYILEKISDQLVIISTHQEQDLEALHGKLLRLPGV